MATTPPRGFLTLADAAEMLGCGRATLYRWVQQGRLTTYRHPYYLRGQLVKRSDVRALQQAEPQRIERDRWVVEQLAKLPPMTDEQAQRVARLLAPYLHDQD